VTAGGSVVQIDPEDELYRRLMSYYAVPTPTGVRASSAAFRDGSKNNFSPNCSVYLARLTTPTDVLSPIVGGLPGQRVGKILASVPMDNGLGVHHSPNPALRNSADYAHTEITGITASHLPLLAMHCTIL